MELKIGDLVKLKSGGPLMAVSSIDKNGEIWCTWFDGNVYKRHAFVRQTLTDSLVASDGEGWVQTLMRMNTSA